jgi:predicted site-specific integrase-resolvase
VRFIEERIVRWMKSKEICERVDVSPRTYEKWRRDGRGPRAVRLPNGQFRTREDWLEEWLDDLPNTKDN